MGGRSGDLLPWFDAAVDAEMGGSEISSLLGSDNCDVCMVGDVLDAVAAIISADG